MVVYPIHVVTFLNLPKFTYTRDSISTMRSIMERICDGFCYCNGELSDQLIAAILMRHLDDKLLDEWTRHITGKTSLPSVHDLLDFFNARQLAMASKPGKPPVKSSASSVKPSSNVKRSMPT